MEKHSRKAYKGRMTLKVATKRASVGQRCDCRRLNVKNEVREMRNFATKNLNTKAKIRSFLEKAGILDKNGDLVEDLR